MRTAGVLSSGSGGCALALAVAGALALAGCATAPPAAPPERLPFPSPADGPGAPELDKQAAKLLEAGWRALVHGDAAAARAGAAEAGANPASRLLELQTRVVAGGPDPTPDLAELAAENPDYAAGWLTLSAAAEAADQEAMALDAAERGAELWPATRWQERARDLRRRFIGDRVDSAERLFGEGRPDAAVEALAPALAIEPDNRSALLVKARSLTALGDLDRAEAALTGLPRDREVILLAGDIAEARGDRSAAIRIYSSLEDDPEALLRAIGLAEEDEDWLTAMNLYGELPDRRPEKAPGLRAAKLRWRVSVMPDYVREALDADPLDRAGLAVILVSLAPRVATMPGGQVPLLSDIVDMPSQREILTAARLGLLDTDPLEPRFDPHRAATPREVRTAVTRLGRLLDTAVPNWCDGPAGDCVQLESPISGERVAEIVIDMVAEEIG